MENMHGNGDDGGKFCFPHPYPQLSTYVTPEIKEG